LKVINKYQDTSSWKYRVLIYKIIYMPFNLLVTQKQLCLHGDELLHKLHNRPPAIIFTSHEITAMPMHTFVQWNKDTMQRSLKETVGDLHLLMNIK